MRNRFFYWIITVIFCFGWSNCTGSKTVSHQGVDAQQKTSKQAGIQWVTLEALPTLMKQQPKKTFIKVYTDWCGWCKRLDATTLATPEIVAYINEHFYAVKFNGETKKTIVFNEKTYKHMRSASSRSGGDHQFTGALLGNRRGYPTTVFLDEQLKKLESLPGYKKPQQMDAILHYFAEEAYKERSNSLVVYEMNFESKIKATEN